MADTIILDGNSLSKYLIKEMKSKVEFFQNISGRVPSLIIFMAGNNPSSEIYVNKKIQACNEIGIKCSFELIDNIDSFFNPEEYMAFAIERANKSDDIDAIIVQLNLPKKFDQNKILSLIDPKKDVDVLIIGHGSIDPNAHISINYIVDGMRKIYRNADCCFLEIEQPDIASGIEKAQKNNPQVLIIVFYFLHEGAHVKTDINQDLKPALEKSKLQQVYITEHIGVDGKMIDLILERAQEVENAN